MADTLSTKLTTWRNTNQSGNGLLSKLSIDQQLYNIKDPAVEALAAEVETRLAAVETKTIRTEALDKPSGAGKFASSVTQSTDGQITVTYSGFTGVTDTVVDGQFVTAVSQNTDGDISVTRGAIDTSKIAISNASLTATTLSDAIAELLAADASIIGASTDSSSANSIAAAKKYADEKVQQLAGEDWTANAQKVQDIINELNGENGAWETLVDKLTGLVATDAGTGATTSLTVKEYVDSKFTEAQSAASGGISDLDKVIAANSGGIVDATNATSTYDNDSTNKVAIKLVEEDGIVTGLNVKTNDIASAAELTTLSASVVKSVNGITPTNNAVVLSGADINLSATDTTKLSGVIDNIQSNKANKAAFSSGDIKTWSVNFSNETLTWTSATTGVYQPSGSAL